MEKIATLPGVGIGLTLSRYNTVCAILDAAAGGSTVNYQGLGRFWHLPHGELLQVVVYGVRMIAPVDEPDLSTMLLDSDGERQAYAASCCAVPAVRGNVQSPARVLPTRRLGRGAASGLIKGLKGEFPFNEPHFPSLPWGGTRLSTEEIAFIEQWIDDGCPETDGEASTQDQQRPKGLVFKAYGEATNTFKRQHQQILARKHIDQLSPLEEDQLRHAYFEMVRLNQYPKDKRNALYWSQVYAGRRPQGHDQFLTWHRMLLYAFEQALQDINPDVTLPWWDWSGEYGEVPRILRCWVNQSAIERIKRLHAGVFSSADIHGLQAVKNIRYNSGAALSQAAGIEMDPQKQEILFSILATVNPLWSPDRYTETSAGLEPAHPPVAGGAGDRAHPWPATQDVERVLSLDTWQAFGGGPVHQPAAGALELPPFNNIAIEAGGLGPGDFLFWVHFANIDRLFWIWQRLHGSVGPTDLQSGLPGLGFSVRDAIETSRLGYEYIHDCFIFPTGRDFPIDRFTSDEISLGNRLLWHQGRVELRLHRVEQPQYSFSVRVFVNQPAANGSTPSDDDHHYAGYFSFFGHGTCIGGPGHCDPPADEKRPYDIRTRHHNTPGNVRLDLTDAVRQQVQSGAKSLSVTLVMVSVAGPISQPFLRTDGISINFLGR